MRIARVARTTAVFIAGICILSASASAGALTPAAKMSGADTVYGSTRGGGPRTCSAFAATCASRTGGSPKCASARADCMQTGVFKGPSGQVFSGMVRQ
jgi:hypothetical protein